MASEETVHPAFDRWFTSQRRAAERPGRRARGSRAAATAAEPPSSRLPGTPDGKLSIGTGELGERIHLDPDNAARLIVVAAKMAAGFFQPTRRSTVVWVEGDSELAVEIGAVQIAIGHGRIDIILPVSCDQTGQANVIVTFAVGEEGQPAGMYASTLRRPIGPTLIIDTWGEALVAFAWRTFLTLISQLAGAAGKDSRGNVLVPADFIANADGLLIQTMGRFRFSGSSGLTGKSR